VTRGGRRNTIGQPEDIANLVTFLASSTLAANITGETINCDGGIRPGC
jgi:NAD(P)-dependent dehydrogenase (short-subunit alcohol dehydrogenase family)